MGSDLRDWSGFAHHSLEPSAFFYVRFRRRDARRRQGFGGARRWVRSESYGEPSARTPGKFANDRGKEKERKSKGARFLLSNQGRFW